MLKYAECNIAKSCKNERTSERISQNKQSSKKKLIKLIKMCCRRDNLKLKLLFRIANNQQYLDKVACTCALM